MKCAACVRGQHVLCVRDGCYCARCRALHGDRIQRDSHSRPRPEPKRQRQPKRAAAKPRNRQPRPTGRKPGRPSTIDPRMARIAEIMRENGASWREIAAHCGGSPDKWRKHFGRS